MRGEFARLFEIALDAARAQGVSDLEAIFTGEDASLTRFANNAIHQNVAERNAHISIRPVIDGRTARASTNRRDEAAIRAVVDEAIALTRLTEADPDLPPMAEAEPVAAIERRVEATAHAEPGERARAVAEAIREVEAAGQTAAGIYSTGESFFGVMNSRGVSAFHSETLARFSITAMEADSSGWAKARAVRPSITGRMEMWAFRSATF
jgi:predicted Zn-dependent protease